MATPDMNYLHCFQDCTPANDEENFYLRKATNGRMPYKGRFWQRSNLKDWYLWRGKGRDSRGMSYHNALEFTEHRGRIGEAFFIRHWDNGSLTALWSMKMMRLGLFRPIVSRVLQ